VDQVATTLPLVIASLLLTTDMVLLHLTATQAIDLYGMWYPKRVLSWKQVEDNPEFSWKRLRACGISPSELYKLQPDPQPWIDLKHIDIQDVTEMGMWNIHPIRQMKCTLSQLALLHWPVDVLIRVGLTYDDLVEAGLSIQTLPIFGFTLLNWNSLGMRKRHLEAATELQCIQAFGMKKAQVCCSLPD
jgi:hypothetical protein